MPAIWWTMNQTADFVAKTYGISREAHDEYVVRSQERVAAAGAAGKFAEEIVPFTTVMKLADKATGVRRDQEVTLDRDEGTDRGFDPGSARWRGAAPHRRRHSEPTAGLQEARGEVTEVASLPSPRAEAPSGGPGAASGGVGEEGAGAGTSLSAGQSVPSRAVHPSMQRHLQSAAAGS